MYLQPKLAYELDGLEPHLDKENLDVHYNKHHPIYISKYNDAVKGTAYEQTELKEVLKNLNSVKDEKLKTAIRNMGGGAWNHSFFWEIMTPAEHSGKPGQHTEQAINQAFGSLETFKEKFKEAALGVFGSGWAWLVLNHEGKLEIVKTANQDCPLSSGQKPLLTIDVWEHAYYLKYKNLRGNFVDAYYRVINWNKVEALMTEK